MIAVPLLLTALVGVGLALGSRQDSILDEYDAAMSKLASNPERTDATSFAELALRLEASGHDGESQKLLRRLADVGLLQTPITFAPGVPAASTDQPPAGTGTAATRPSTRYTPGTTARCRAGACVLSAARGTGDRMLVGGEILRVVSVSSDGTARVTYGRGTVQAPLYEGIVRTSDLSVVTGSLLVTPASGPSPFGGRA